MTLAAGVFSVNAIVLTRSRGAMVGIALGDSRRCFSLPEGYRTKIFAGCWWQAWGDSIWPTRHSSRESQPLTAKAMNGTAPHRAGLKPGPCPSECSQIILSASGLAISSSMPEFTTPRYDGRDAHNTYVRCFTELGIPGFLLFLGLIVNAIVISKRTIQKAYDLPPEYQKQILMPSFGLAVGFCMMLGCGMTVTLLYTEALWWFLLMPVCVARAADNLAADLAKESR